MDDNTATRTKRAARETIEQAQESTSNAAEAFRDYQLKVFAVAQDNMMGMFEYMQDVMKARSLPDLFEISTRHSQRQLARMTENAQEIAGFAQKMASVKRT